jgi:hypothetical protein
MSGSALFPTILLLVAQQPDPPGQVRGGEAPVHQAYLFAHMVHEEYGRLRYSASTDGLHWQRLNGGRVVLPDYRGHPDIARGRDERFYLVGNPAGDAPVIHVWASDDLVKWEKHAEYVPELGDVPGYAALPKVGAPKVFYDEPSKAYLLTWHTPHEWGTPRDPERYWASQRTLYVTSKDMKSFDGPPKRLFPDWDLATIDVIIRPEGGRYHAILKDERYPTLDWPTGKTIRISSAAELLGPYDPPGPPISPSFREAPTVIPSPDGKAWYLYYERYPGVEYGLSAASTLGGPWFQVSGYTFHADWDKYALPPGVRHGAMLPITRAELDRLVEAFGIEEPPPQGR